MNRMILGIKKPKIESVDKISDFLDSKGLSMENCYVFRDSVYINILKKNQVYLATYEVYDSKWNRLIPSDSLTNGCYGRISTMLKQLNSDKKWVVDSLNKNWMKAHLIHDLKSLDKKEEISTRIDAPEKLIVFYWAIFMGRYTKDLLDIEKELIEQKIPGIKIININMDMRENMQEKYKAVNFNFTNGK